MGKQTFILQELDIEELSLVDKAANKRKFLLIKSEGGAVMPKEEIILEIEEGRAELVKSVAGADDTMLALVKSVMEDEELIALLKALEDDSQKDAIEKAGISPKAAQAVKGALNMLKAVKDELPADILKKLSELGGYAMPEQKMEKPMEDDKDKMKKSFAGYTIVKNEDGTVDFSDIPEESRPLVKALWDENEATREKAEKAEALAKAERDERILKEFITKAAGYESIPSDAAKLGPVLKAASEKLTDDQYAEIERLLKAADEMIKEGALFKAAGKDGDGDGVDDSAYGKLSKEAHKIAKAESMDFESAFVAATERNPDLAEQERKERP